MFSYLSRWSRFSSLRRRFASGKRASDPLRSQLRPCGTMRSHVGMVRKSNEDCVVFVAPPETAPEQRVGFLALVADGMGGHAAGEVASALAAETVRRLVYATPGAPDAVLRQAFAAANRAIRSHAAADPTTSGMGTTCTAILVQEGLLWLAHVGDSRAYIMRGGHLHQLSEDQTLHARLVRDGAMTAEEAAVAPGGNVLLQALGADDSVDPQIFRHGLPLSEGDRILLCSDGLYAHLDAAGIAATLRGAADPDEASERLVDQALAGGGSDNVSVGVFVVERAGARKDGGQTATKPMRID